MDQPTVILANFPDGENLPALADSINKAFGSEVRAKMEFGRLVLQAHGIKAQIEPNGELYGVDAEPTQQYRP